MRYVGIDWADKDYTVVVIDEDGKQIGSSFKIKISSEGFTELLEKIRKYESDLHEIKIG